MSPKQTGTFALNNRQCSRVIAAFAAACLSTAQADTPLGWINGNNPAAYTTTAGELDISLAGFRLDDTIDFLDVRDELLERNDNLGDSSGDFTGSRLELNYGILETLSVFYRREEQSLTLDLQDISSINLLDIDDSLDTTSERAGLKWTFYQANLLNPDNRIGAASIELMAYRNRSDDFSVVLDEILLDNLTVIFRDPQTFSVDRLEDEGWRARFVYTWPLSPASSGSLWLGYGESEATSGTTSDIASTTIARFFEQEFNLDEEYLYIGASLNLQLSPRLPLLVSYEYIDIRDSKLTQIPENPSLALPSFLSGTNQAQEPGNHHLHARASYWLTPQLNLSVTGDLFSNQFLGQVPHYNNPLSGSLSSAPYGFVGVEVGYKIQF